MAQQDIPAQQEHAARDVQSCHNDSCPFAATPLAECHCRRFTGQSIPIILRYCGGEYFSCPIYRRSTAAILPAPVCSSEVPQ